MKKKICLVVLFVLFLLPMNVFAKVKVYLFRSDTCSICKSAVAFFEDLANDEEYKDLFEVVDLEISTGNNSELMQEAGEIMGDGSITGVPYIIIGDKSYNGYTSSWDDDIKAQIVTTSEDEDFVDPLEDLIVVTEEEESSLKETLTTILIILIACLLIGGVIAIARRDNDYSFEETKSNS